jgi:Tfp pilus assembly protein PilW
MRGFSLIELVIYLGIVAMLTVAISDVFISVSAARGQGQVRSDTSSEIRFALESIRRDARSSSAVLLPAGAGATGTVLRLATSEGTVEYAVTEGIVRRQAGSLSSEAITSSNVSADGFVVSRIESANQALAATTTLLRIRLQVTGNRGSVRHTETAETTIATFETI